jgi:hypothetical protein
MGIVGITLDATRPFHSKYDDKAPGDAEAIVWTIGTLDSRIGGIIQDMSAVISIDPSKPDDDIKTSMNTRDVAFNRVMFGLKGWNDAFKDKNGTPIPFQTRKLNKGGVSYLVVDPVCLSKVPQPVIEELADAINEDNELTERDAKN